MITRNVTIPACQEHQGFHRITIALEWKCPKCGRRRGKILGVLSFDGSRRLSVDGWTNPCGHVDTYAECRNEAAENGLNAGAIRGRAA